MRMSVVPGRLSWKFVAPIAILIVLTSVTLGWFFINHEVDLITRALVARGTSLTRNLAYHLEYELQFGTEQRLQELIQGVIAQEDVLYVVVVGADGGVRAQAKAAQLLKIPPLDAPRAARDDMSPPGHSTVVDTVQWGGERIYEIVQPVKTRVGREREEIGLTLGGGERRIGAARLGMSLSLTRVDATITRVKRTLFIVTSLVIAVGVLVTVVLVRIVVKPLRALAGAAREIEEGKLEAAPAVTVKSRDEIGDLSAAFNRMAAALRAREAENTRLFGELDETNRRLEAASRHKSQFLANMSHELRTPLNAIIGFSEILLSEPTAAAPAERREFQGNILTAGRHLLGLISELLDLSKIEAGKMALSPEILSVREALDGVFETVRPLAAKQGLELQLEVDPGLTTVLADPAKLRQILFNLVSNAIRFTPDGGRVSVAARRADGEARFAVRDTGIGISAADQERIFSEFYQVQSTAAKTHGGTGLGLTLVKKLVELHGGRVWVESAPGQGSTFTFTLPLAGPAPVREPEPSRAGGPAGPLVLLVEDDQGARDILRFSLGAAGYRVAEARDGDEALAKAGALQPAAITLDVRLPGKDGWEVLTELKRDPATHDIPVLIVSIVDEPKRGFSLGAADYILKPFDRADLLRRLARQGVAPRSQADQPTALIVGSDEAVLDELAGTLARAGFAILRARSAADGVRFAGERRPHAILLSLLTPEMNALEIMRALRTGPRTRGIPVFAVVPRNLDAASRQALTTLVTAVLDREDFSTTDFLEEIARLTGPGRPGAGG